MTDVKNLITDNIDIWTNAIKKRNATGRGSSKKIELRGIKKLRELILELAVRGKLVPQDANDEPASVLLEKIAAEKAQLIADKKIKKQKDLPEITDEEKLFELPQGWAWTRLGDSGDTNVGLTYSPKDAGDVGTPVLRSTNIQKGKIDLNELVRVDMKVKESAHVYEGDLLICARNGSKALVGKTASIPKLSEPMAFGAFMAIYRSPFNRYFEKFINSPIFRRNLTGVNTTTINQITQGNLRSTVASVPPLAEQHRIVAKVDELMALCDKLEQQTEQSLTAHQTLVEVLLATLTQSANTNIADVSVKDRSEKSNESNTKGNVKGNAEDFQTNWQRIAEHFDVLFTTEASIEQLKQTILQLAVMGKLVPQNPNDEPASVLLKKIAEEKAQLIADKKIKKQKSLSEITDEDKPFELPNGWEWVRFEDVVDIQGGVTKGRKLSGRELIKIPYLSVANVQRSYLDLGYLKEVEIPVEEKDKYRVIERDLLITEGGDWDKVGRTAIWANELPYVGHQNHVFKARIFIKEQCEVWLEKYLNGPYARDYFAGSSKQTTNLASINKTQLRGCTIAMPPTNEINLIVAKVDELMGICDQLKARLTDAQTTQLHLADAVVENALN